MALVKASDNSAVGIRYQYIIDNTIEEIKVPINTYFYNKETKTVYYKDANNNILNTWDYKNYTDEESVAISIALGGL